MPTLRLLPEDVTAEVEAGTTILQAARTLGVEIAASCGSRVRACPLPGRAGCGVASGLSGSGGRGLGGRGTGCGYGHSDTDRLWNDPGGRGVGVECPDRQADGAQPGGPG
ncbi:MAG: 2Fe-2S iron-sulfur cluster-binding protein [Planctomycetota bacterium]